MISNKLKSLRFNLFGKVFMKNTLKCVQENTIKITLKQS